MGEVNGDFDGVLNAGEEEEGRVHEWESGLPNADDITPLNHGLIPQKLLLAFNIKLDPCRTEGDVIQASEDTISTIGGQSSGSNFKSFDYAYDDIDEDDGEAEAEDDGDASDSKKPRRNESPEETDSAAAAEKTLKRPRLVWTPQLHKRFVDVVTHLGIKNAVPKTIMQLMNVEGLTRENVASHLQKYRLYLKRMQGVNFDGAPSNSSAASTEKLFVSPPVLGNSQENGSGSRGNGNGNTPVPIPMPYEAPPMVPMPVPMMGIGHGHMSMDMGMAMTNYNGFESNRHHHHHNNQ